MTPQNTAAPGLALPKLPVHSAMAVFEVLFEHSLEAALLTRPSGELLAANPAACAMFGASQAALCQRSREGGLETLADPTDDRLAPLRAERSSKGHARGEARLRRMDGEIFDAELSSSLFLDEAGLPTSILTVRDISAFRAAQRAARDSEQRLAFALAAADIGHWETDLRSNVMHRSLGHDRCFGYTEPVSEWGYDTFLAHVDPADRERVDQCYQLALAGQADYDVEFRVTWSDGSLHWLWSKGRFYTDAAGQPLRAAGIQVDITERRRAEQVLRDSEQQLRLALRGGDLGLWDRDAPTGQMRVNGRWKSMLGLDPQGPTPSTEAWRALVHPDDLHKLERLMQAVMLDPARDDFEIELRARHSQGHFVWILDKGSVVERAPDGSALRVVGTHLDITARKQAEALLREREAVLLQAQRLARVGSWRWRSSDSQSDWSDEACRIFGVDRASFVASQENFLALVHPDDREAVVRARSEALAGTRPYDIEYRAITPAGELRHLHGRASVMRDEATGRPVAMLGTVLDITERVLAQQQLARHGEELEREVAERTRELEAARDAAESANRAKSTFLSRMSHELRTPLNAVLGFSQLLEIDPAVRALPRVATQIGHIRSAGDHLLAMIDEVLDLARVESGKLLLTPEAVDVGALVRACFALVDPLARKHQITLQVDGADAGHRVQADLARLRQVLVNLLTNAVKYNRPAGQVLVALSRHAERVEVAVADTGVGLSAEQLARLYEPFNRLGAEATRVEGTGLGLVIAQQLVLALGGSLRVRSKPGQGAVFTLSLPVAGQGLAAPRQAPARADLPPGPASASPLRVLYVEDNPINAELVRQILAGRPGVQLEIAVDGPSGLEAARRLLPDLILLDIDLPGMSGFDVLRALRQESALAAVPCIAVSANAMDIEIGRALRAGFKRYLTKPFVLGELVFLVESYRGLASALPVRAQRNGPDAA